MKGWLLARERLQQGGQPQGGCQVTLDLLLMMACNEPLARERVQQRKTKGCHQPHLKGWNGTNVLKLTVAHLPQRSHGRP
jgi:hypothetical protein